MKVYLAGPHLHDDYRARAKALLEPEEIECLDPIRRDFRGKEAGKHDEIVRGDLIDIAACDAVLADWTGPAVGTSMECWYAFSIGRPIYGWIGEARLSPWYAYLTPIIKATLDVAVETLLVCEVRVPLG